MPRWVRELGADLGVRFESVDVPAVSSLDEWRAWARRHGWSKGMSR
jgi:hypothetical protein